MLKATRFMGSYPYPDSLSLMFSIIYYCVNIYLANEVSSVLFCSHTRNNKLRHCKEAVRSQHYLAISNSIYHNIFLIGMLNDNRIIDYQNLFWLLFSFLNYRFLKWVQWILHWLQQKVTSCPCVNSLLIIIAHAAHSHPGRPLCVTDWS